jgi:ribose transport system permease protein
VTRTDDHPAVEVEPVGMIERIRLSGTSRLRISAVREYGIVFAFAAMFVTLSVTSPVFLTSANLLNVLNQSSDVGIIAVAGTLVVIAGGFDLSVGATYAVGGVVAAQLTPHIGVFGSLLAGVLVGLGFGLANGAIVTVGRINPFIGTLASQIMIRGFALVLTGGALISVTNTSFATLGQGTVFTVRYAVIVWLVFGCILAYILGRTTFGRYVYAVGGNAEAARLSGVRVGLVRGATFALSGLAAGLAGIVAASRVSTGQADTGVGLELSAIAAIVIGGTSILGGEGAVWRTVLGVLLITMIGNGFNLLDVNPTYQQIFQGTIILVAVGIDAFARRSRR